MNIKKDSFSLNKEDFDKLLVKYKNDSKTIKVFEHLDFPFYYFYDLEINETLAKVNKLQIDFDNKMRLLSQFARN